MWKILRSEGPMNEADLNRLAADGLILRHVVQWKEEFYWYFEMIEMFRTKGTEEFPGLKAMRLTGEAEEDN